MLSSCLQSRPNNFGAVHPLISTQIPFILTLQLTLISLHVHIYATTLALSRHTATVCGHFQNPSHAHTLPLPSRTQVTALCKGRTNGVVCFIYFDSLVRMAAVKLHFYESLYKHCALEPAHLTWVRGCDPYMPCAQHRLM